ncbi:MAG: hypothetical protein QOI11_2525 [Candidatus Eremiobacteraeota bacterium]|nr:hypothetical protein [Candidatus Eremiobacteraeota bacterium]
MVAVQTAAATLFELTHDDTKIVYSPGSLDGAPSLHYAGPMGKYTFKGDEIETHRSARGLEISVTLDRVSLLRTFTLTVFLTDLELDMTDEMTFTTVGINASRRRALTSRLGAALTSEPIEFEGLARNIEYQASGTTVLL